MILFVCIVLTNVFLLNSFAKIPLISGSGISTASVSLVILGPGDIFILSPLNITYNFSIGDNYTIDLNVSADAGIEVYNWWYSLWDMKHSELINDTIEFTPNTTFDAVRWSNRLYVYANTSAGDKEAFVDFFVFVPNSAPILGDINSSIYVCEGSSLNYEFNATDVDEDDIIIDISPKNPFYVHPTFFSGEVYMNSNIVSGILSKTHVGVYEETVSVSDGEYVDTNDTKITVIEINNEPVMENIGVQTIWLTGENSSFDKQVSVTDIEEGDQDSGNLSFNISFSGEHLFDISSNGVMNFTPNDSSQVGVHNITVCVNDTGIDAPHENISIECGQDGGPITVCQNFSLTITNENRPPTITDYYPNELELNVSGTDSLYFNITEYDPDGTFPDAYWYVDEVLKEYDSGSLIDEFTYSFGCGVSGEHLIKVEITDGVANDSVEWNLDVAYVSCPVSPPPSGGGGGRTTICSPLWVCSGWSICQNTEKSLELGNLSGEDYRNISEQCAEDNLDKQTCGVHIRECLDLNNCSTDFKRPVEVQFCHYTEEPSCYDGIKNCHHGACELLMDCGGPCSPCPTCSDGIQNQGEEGIDCGGPCPWKCEPEKPLIKKKWLFYLILIIFLLLLLIAIIKIIRVLKMKKGTISKNQQTTKQQKV